MEALRMEMVDLVVVPLVALDSLVAVQGILRKEMVALDILLVVVVEVVGKRPLFVEEEEYLGSQMDLVVVEELNQLGLVVLVVLVVLVELVLLVE